MQKPNFYLSYYNPYEKGNPGMIQSYINYKRDINNIEYNASIISNSIKEASKEQIKAIEQGFKKMDERLSQIYYAHQTTNLLLFDIIELLKLPDSEKQRQLHIINGIKFISKSAKNKSIISDAIIEFEKAIELKQQDWLSHYYLGISQLHYVENLNIDKAKYHFEIALKYALLDDEFNEKINLSIGLNQIYEELDEKNKFLEEVKEIKIKEIPTTYILDIYLNLIKIEYILGDYLNGLRKVEELNRFKLEYENKLEIEFNENLEELKEWEKDTYNYDLYEIRKFLFEINDQIILIYHAKFLIKIKREELAIKKIEGINNTNLLLIAKNDSDILKLKIDDIIENKINRNIERVNYEKIENIENKKIDLITSLLKYYVNEIIEKIDNNDIRYNIREKKIEIGLGYTYSIYVGKIKQIKETESEKTIKILYEKYRNDQNFLIFLDRIEVFKKNNKQIYFDEEIIEKNKYYIPETLNSVILLREFLNYTNFEDWNKREAKILKRIIKKRIDAKKEYSDLIIHLKKYSLIYLILLIAIDITLIIKNEDLFKVFNISFIIIIIVKLLADKANGKNIN
jgi:hypothetical protein